MIEFKTHSKIGENEPVFLIRAQDIVSVPAVRAWAELHKAAGGDEKLYFMALKHADLMEAWQQTYRTKCADLPDKY